MAVARLWLAIACAVALTVACTSDDETPQGQEASQAEQPGALAPRLPSACTGLDSPRGNEITFTSGEALFSLDADSSQVRCLLDDLSSNLVAWGAEADRVLFDNLQTALVGGRGRAPSSTVALSPRWSRPTGSSVIYVAADGDKLLKAPSTGGAPENVSFLKRHDAVVYHPAGTHIAVVGKSKRGDYGLFLADNLGKKSQLLARGEDARRLLAPVFSHDGRTLYFVGDHGDHFDLHSLDMSPQPPQRKQFVNEGRLRTLDSGPEEFGGVIPSEFTTSPFVAYRKGSCESQVSTHIWNGRRDAITQLSGPLRALSTQPIGWLKPLKLVVLARPDGCTGPGDLYLWNRNGARLLRRGVTSAAARAVLPPPPRPPDAPDEVVA